MDENEILGGMESFLWPDSQQIVKYYRSIAKIMEEIHSQIPVEQYHLDEVATESDIREEYFNGINYKRAVMYLLTNGCEWALKNGNGCTMCGHLAKQTRQNTLSDQNYMDQFRSEFNRIDFSKYPLLNLYNNGSFFNDREIPPIARVEIFKMINNTPEIKMLVLESRPEFITEHKMQEVKKYIPDQYVEVAMGLELYDDMLRYISINKGFTLKQYNESVELITSNGLNLRTYVLLKPLFLTEKEAVEQTIKTICHAFAAGSSTVSLETCTIQEYTLVYYMNKMGYFKSAWLWSIVEVVKQTAHLGKLIVGLFQFYPSPVRVPYNCPKCSDKVMDALKEYNRTLDISCFEHLDCECKKLWEKELHETSISFEERLKVISQISTIGSI